MDSAGLGGSVEEEVWELFDADNTVADEIVYLVAAALLGDAELNEQLAGDASVPQRPDARSIDAPQPLRAFVRSITVEGFRGIGPRTSLELNPYCGITVVSGRNGSGKSSFSEALEFALTGQSYRWSNKKGQHWGASWRNLHAGEPARIAVEFAMEPDDQRSGSTATVGTEWAAGDELNNAYRWSQIRGQKRQPVEALGWSQPMVTHRPIMSYDELGGRLEDGPSKLYDALNRLLGLDQISDADNRLKEAEKRLGVPRKAANDARTQLRRNLDVTTDPRAGEVKKLTAKAPYDLAAITATTLGTGTDQAVTVARLRTIASFEVPEPTQAAAVANELRAAIDAHATSAGPAVNAIAERATVLREALHLHTEIGESLCPVCETGTLNDAWRAEAEERLKEADASTAEHHTVTQRLARARAAAAGFFTGVADVDAVDGVDLATLSAINNALTQARSAPGNLSDLPGHLESATTALADVSNLLRAEATERASELENVWAPVASTISAWTQLETAARKDDANLDRVKEALTWLRTNATTLRERRMAPMVGQARDIWERMRHESNVDLGSITLKGNANRREAVVEGAVDGVPAGALSVMSQGELHALALALFIPRATTPASPFRFLMLDDPIQAMDPAKIGGFLDVLIELAKTRQVVVFSHDDRLPAAIRARSLPAQLLDVTRETGSVVVVRENDIPAHRYIADATAVVLDDDMDDVVKRKAAPGLFRMAVEAAAHQRYFTDRATAGSSYHEFDAAWEDAKTTQQCVALAVTGDATNDLTAWKSRRAHRFPTIAICASGAHNGAALDRTTIRELRETVRDIVENR